MPIVLGAFGVIALAAVGVLALAATKPATFRIERTMRVRAAPERIFQSLEDFHRWAAWSPWEKLDPALERTFGGAERGVGATYAWRGNSKAGEGKMTVLESRPGERLVIRLEFVKPFAATNTATFTITPVPGGESEISWAMEGPNTTMGKVMSVFTSMDAFLGPQFDEGLANLKRLAESA